ncbi:MAG: hypothetical protein NTX45_07875 [Proteobacteria bacterium]|nr:hypothetical protein [Pseudomonadota bacterium]
MAYLNTPISAASGSLNCPSNWIALSCDGTYNTKDVAQMMLDQVQLAWATKRYIYVQVDDSKLHNGYCTATRVDVWL